MIKIFSPNKIIYLINSEPSYKLKKDAVLVNIESKDDLRKKYAELIDKNDVKEIYFFYHDLDKLFKYFSKQFKIIEAAGGLVRNEHGEWLFIFRNEKWDLPKGKIEKGEGIETAGIREVEEECGVRKLRIVKALPPTYHIYETKKNMVLKKTYWFEMTCKDDSKLSPQLEEGITEVKWIAEKNLKQVYDNTFESVKEVLRNIEE